CHIENGFSCPVSRIGIQIAEAILRLHIRGEVCQEHVVVAVCEQGIANWSECPRFVAAEVIREDEVQRDSRLYFVLIVPVRVVPALTVLNLLDGQAEQKQILFSRFFGHFDGGAVKRADRESSVHHELHVAGSAGFVPCGGNLVRNVAGGNQPLCQR